MKKLKGTRKFFLVVTAIFLIFASCKHPQEEEPKTENITVTVKKDTHVTKALDSFTLAKGTKLGFTALKEKIAPEFASTYVISKITLNDATGDEITNSAPYTFNADTTIYVSSRKEGTDEKLELTELKVAGKSVTIQDVMEAGQTREAKVLIEAKATPGDAEVIYEPSLVDNYWVLEVGKKNLKIKVKKGSKEKTYTLNIERLDADIPILKKLTVGDKSKEGTEIKAEMSFSVSNDKDEIEVKAETEPKDAPISYSPSLTNGKLTLLDDETTLTIKVGVAPKISTYTVNVKKLVQPRELIDTLLVLGGKINGADTMADMGELNKVLNDEIITVEVAGPEAKIGAASQTKSWTSFKINGVPFDSFAYAHYKSIAFAGVKLPEKGEEMDIKIEVTDVNSSAEVNFKIRRTDLTVDVPVDKLYIRDKNVLSEDDTERGKLHDENQKPEFDGAEPSNIEIEASQNVLKSITINGTAYTDVIEKKDSENRPIWTVKGSVSGVHPSGKDVTMIIEPIDTEAYHPITWTFRLKYKAAEMIRLDYEINGKNTQKLPADFVQKINTNANPSIELEAKYLNIRLACGGRIEKIKVKVNENETEIKGDDLVALGENYVLNHSVPIDATEKQITIEVIPADKGVYSSRTLKFKAKGNGAFEKIEPTFEEISGDTNLQKETFLDKLSGSDKPLYKTAYETADIVINLGRYNYDFLCKEVKINEEKVEITVEQGYFGNSYKIKKSIPVNKDTPIDVKIEFVANAEKAENLIWQFRLQGGGDNPSLPKNKVSIFKINGVGSSYNNQLPKSLTDHLTDGTNPEYEFDGNKALVEVGCLNDVTIENVVFKLDGEKKHEMAPKKEGLYAYIAKYAFEIPGNEAHNVEIIITPKDKQYSNLIYKFKLKWSGNKAPLPLTFAINRYPRPNGYTVTFNSESAKLLVQAKLDVMGKVFIGEEGQEVECTITSFTSTTGATIWQAEKSVSLVDANGDAATKTFIIKVTPKSSEDYRETVCRYIITGTKIPNNNAEFVWITGQEPSPKVLSDIEWMPGLPTGGYADDYGAKAVTFEAHTISSRATVKYQILDMKGNAIQGYEAKNLTNENGVHKSEKITLFSDKPTKIKLWVIAADGITINDEKGKWEMIYNPVDLAWEYENKGDKGYEYKKGAYDVIELERDKVTDPAKKIYLVFAPWKEDFGYTVVNTDLPQEQTPFVKIGAMNGAQEYYKTTVDVSSLLDGSKQELMATLKMKRNGKDCLTYNVKIKVK